MLVSRTYKARWEISEWHLIRLTFSMNNSNKMSTQLQSRFSASLLQLLASNSMLWILKCLHWLQMCQLRLAVCPGFGHGENKCQSAWVQLKTREIVALVGLLVQPDFFQIGSVLKQMVLLKLDYLLRKWLIATLRTSDALGDIWRTRSTIYKRKVWCHENVWRLKKRWVCVLTDVMMENPLAVIATSAR